MDAAEALDFAFLEGLKVRGRAAREAARVALAVHASRTGNAAPFLARDPRLACDAVERLRAQGRSELALRVSLWAATGGAQDARAPEGPFSATVAAFEEARSWAEAGGEASPAWIRGVPREAPLRDVFAERLQTLGHAKGEAGRPFAAAALETLLAEAPRPGAYPMILEAAANAVSLRVVERTLEGLSGLGQARSGRGARDPLDRLREALEVEQERAEGVALTAIVESRTASADAASAVLLGHLGAAAQRQGLKGEAARAIAAGKRALEGAARVPRASLAALLFIERGLDNQAAADPLSMPAETRPSATEIVEGACEAVRALGSAKTAVDAMRLFDPEDVTVAASEKDAAQLLKELVREGAQAAVGPGEVEALEALLARIRRIGLRLPWEVYLRARIADGAAAVAAR
ncbi:MAG TPA: hypothetical protein VIW03_12115, partial [Anaeromyxobacter sp.]